MTRIQLACYCLVACACVLAGLLLVDLQRHLPAAQAGEVSSKGELTMLTARTKVDEETLIVIDNQSDKLVVYDVTLGGGRGRMEPIIVQDLGKIFDFGGPAAPAGPAPRERMSR